jgi:hypothetical protein
MAEATWSAELPRETIAAVRAAAGELLDEIVATIRAENPVYADVLGGPEGIGIRLGIERAIGAFLDAAESGEAPGAAAGEVWRRLGEAEFQAGRSLEALREAFHTGTRAAWRGAARLATGVGIDASALIALAEAIFVYTDELAADVVEGYLRMQSDEAGERERRRRRLATLLLDPDGYDGQAVARAAALGRWALPRALALLALDGDAPRELIRRLESDVLLGADAGGAYLILPDPDGPRRAAKLARALDGIGAALGPTVEPPDAYRSLRWARAALELWRRGALPDASPVLVAEHLPSVILLRDEQLARTLVQRCLAPLAGLPQAERERLLETLAAWLAHQRHTPGVAAELHVHAQTVRYRIAKLRELLGDALDGPDGRFELELALRARAALRQQPRVTVARPR